MLPSHRAIWILCNDSGLLGLKKKLQLLNSLQTVSTSTFDAMGVPGRSFCPVERIGLPADGKRRHNGAKNRNSLP